jgi:hypothetical protein
MHKMKNDASSIEDVDSWPIGKFNLPPRRAEQRAFEKKVLTEQNTTVNSPETLTQVELNPSKKNLRYPGLNGRRTRETGSSKANFHARPEVTAEIRQGSKEERQVRQQVHANKRPNEHLKRTDDCGTLLDMCRQAAEKAVATEGETDRKVVEVLAGIAELKRLASTNPAAKGTSTERTRPPASGSPGGPQTRSHP